MEAKPEGGINSSEVRPKNGSPNRSHNSRGWIPCPFFSTILLSNKPADFPGLLTGSFQARSLDPWVKNGNGNGSPRTQGFQGSGVLVSALGLLVREVTRNPRFGGALPRAFREMDVRISEGPNRGSTNTC